MARPVASVGRSCMRGSTVYTVVFEQQETRGTSHMQSIASKTVHVCEEGCVWLVGSRGTTGANEKRSWLFHGMRQATRPHLAHWTSSTCCVNARTHAQSNQQWCARTRTYNTRPCWLVLPYTPPTASPPGCHQLSARPRCRDPCRRGVRWCCGWRCTRKCAGDLEALSARIWARCARKLAWRSR